jgi:hypothetical protein
MRCDRCQGNGRIWHGRPGTFDWEPRPCEDCQGSGLAHCCDGLCEQPSELRHTGISGWPLEGSPGLYDPIDIHKDAKS